MRVRFCTRDVVALRTCVRPRNDVIHEMIDVLRPFYRDGRHIPDLLRPREHVTVDPAIRGGVPVIEGTRVPYDKVAALLLDDVPAERISDYYPSVTASAAMDAADFADLRGQLRHFREAQ